MKKVVGGLIVLVVVFACSHTIAFPAKFHFTGRIENNNTHSIAVDMDDIARNVTNNYLVVHYEAVDGVNINDITPFQTGHGTWKLVRRQATANVVEAGDESYSYTDWAFYYERRTPRKKRAVDQHAGVGFKDYYWKWLEPGEDVPADGSVIFAKKEDAADKGKKRKRAGFHMEFSWLGNGPIEWVEKPQEALTRSTDGSDEEEDEDEKEPEPVYETLPNGRKVQVIGTRRYVVDENLAITKPQIEVLPNGVAIREGTDGHRIRVNIDTLEDIDQDKPRKEFGGHYEPRRVSRPSRLGSWTPRSNARPPNVPEGQAYKPGRPKVHAVNYFEYKKGGGTKYLGTVTPDGDFKEP